MRKKLPVLLMLFTLLCTASVTKAQTSTEGIAENFLWYRLVANSVERIQVPQQVVASMDGNLFASNMFYSKERTDASSVFNLMLPTMQTRQSLMVMMVKQPMAMSLSPSTK